jgi:signal peptidase I
MAETTETNVVDTLQSLIIAFALAMTVRSFVTEGFVIPTGSMAPTLMGAHVAWESPESGYRYSLDSGPLFDPNARNLQRPMFDPMLSMTQFVALEPPQQLAQRLRMGDRVLVLKFLYSFFEPHRWDVVVFKNPTDPVGDTQNYIKRLVGLPEEQLLVIDGDIWTAPLGAGIDAFRIQRKPEYVQRAVWQPVHDSDFIPVDPDRTALRMRQVWDGPPWLGEDWSLRDRSYAHPGSEPTSLRWRLTGQIPIDDRSAYNLFRPAIERYPVSDVRIAAAIEADDPASLATEFDLLARSHVFRWSIKGGSATLSVRLAETGEVTHETTVPLVLPPAGRACDVEFWQVDQVMSLWLNGVEAARLPIDDWTVPERVRYSYFGRTWEEYREDPVDSTLKPTPPQIEWRFAGSPVALHRVRVDRDLYYRPGRLMAGEQMPTNGPPIEGLAFGTDVDAPAQLQADQFLMMGDNSGFSRDGRLWGRPHPLVTRALGVDAPFVVPRALLLGKAWCVYFPSPLPIPMPGGGQGKPLVPDFGSLRFVR